MASSSWALLAQTESELLPVREVAVTLLYLLAAVLFIIGLRGLGSPRTARRGNQIAAVGMLLAILVTVGNLLDDPEAVWWTVGAGLVVGAGVGAYLALKVQMTAMPQLVAAFNGSGGGASALIASMEVVRTGGAFTTETAVVVVLSLLIGTITFSKLTSTRIVTSSKLVNSPSSAVRRRT
jgi:NAD(P) transhydrogenase subunit beta